MCWVLARLPCLGFSVHATNTQLPSAMATIPMGVNVIRGVSTIILLANSLSRVAEEYKKECAQRAGVEGTISQAVGAFGLRRARYCGQPKTHLQHVLVDAAPPMGRGHCPLSSLELRRPLFDKGLGGLPKILRQVQPQAAGVIGALVFHAAGEPA